MRCTKKEYENVSQQLEICTYCFMNKQNVKEVQNNKSFLVKCHFYRSPSDSEITPVQFRDEKKVLNGFLK